MIKKNGCISNRFRNCGIICSIKMCEFCTGYNCYKKNKGTESNTNYAQGGIAGVMDPKDSL
jgi:aspartate oxidase